MQNYIIKVEFGGGKRSAICAGFTDLFQNQTKKSALWVNPQSALAVYSSVGCSSLFESLYSCGSIPYSFLKHSLKYRKSTKPTS